MAAYKLHYFNIKILGEPIRFLFHAAGVPFEDIRVDEKDWPAVKDKSKWGFLPVLEFDGIELAESCAISRYLANKFGMAGSNAIEAALIDELVDVCKDMRLEWRKYYFVDAEPAKSQGKENFIKITLPKYLPKFEKMLTENKSGWLIGSKYSWGDFFLVTFLQVWEDTIDAQILDDYPALQALKKAVLEIPGIDEYIKTRPVNDI